MLCWLLGRPRRSTVSVFRIVTRFALSGTIVPNKKRSSDRHRWIDNYIRRVTVKKKEICAISARSTGWDSADIQSEEDPGSSSARIVKFATFVCTWTWFCEQREGTTRMCACAKDGKSIQTRGIHWRTNREWTRNDRARCDRQLSSLMRLKPSDWVTQRSTLISWITRE